MKIWKLLVIWGIKYQKMVLTEIMNVFSLSLQSQCLSSFLLKSLFKYTITGQSQYTVKSVLPCGLDWGPVIWACIESRLSPWYNICRYQAVTEFEVGRRSCLLQINISVLLCCSVYRLSKLYWNYKIKLEVISNEHRQNLCRGNRERIFR